MGMVSPKHTSQSRPSIRVGVSVKVILPGRGGARRVPKPNKYPTVEKKAPRTSLKQHQFAATQRSLLRPTRRPDYARSTFARRLISRAEVETRSSVTSITRLGACRRASLRCS